MGKLGTECLIVYQEWLSYFAKHFNEEIINKHLGLYIQENCS